MPSRRGLPPPPPPKGAKPVKLMAVSMLERVRRRKKIRIFLPILYTLIGVLVVIALVMGYLAIAAGLLRPSWIAGIYREPLPTRTILDAPVIEPSVFEQRVADALALHPTSTTETVIVSESDLTGLVQSSSKQLAEHGVQLNKGQVVILPDHLELFAEVQKDGHVLDIIGTFVTHISNGTASIEWQDVKIGSLSVSPAFAQSLISRYLGQPAASIRASFGNALLQSIHLEDGKAELVFEKK